jgi:L-alanine-DL-glutamate epimerase-like enolase superfamily enzyme
MIQNNLAGVNFCGIQLLCHWHLLARSLMQHNQIRKLSTSIYLPCATQRKDILSFYGSAIGWGQSIPSPMWSYETLETVTIVLRDYLGPALIGRNPLDIDGAHRALDRALAPGFSTAMPIARSGLDIALHDLSGKIRGQSLSQMWNRPRGGPMKLSWTVNARTLDEAKAVIDAGYKRGYSNFNIKVAPNPEFDIRLARLVRRRVPEGFLWADANGGYDQATALIVAPKLADAGVDVLEAPLRPNRISGYRALKKQGALPILMDEGIVSPVELVEFIRLDMLDGVAMKPSRCGGLTPAKQQNGRLKSLWMQGLCG